MNQRYRKKDQPHTPTAGPDRNGRLFVLSAPSGAGKSTLCRRVLDRFPDLVYSVSYTTRAPRESEQDGVDYHFIPKSEFEKGLAHGRWAEWAMVHQNYYGTSSELLNQGLQDGQDILLDIDVQGMRQILTRYPASITIFIMPPSLDELRCRLESRGTDSPAAIAVRLENAQKEMAQKGRYRHVIVNDQLSAAAAELIGIFETYRS